MPTPADPPAVDDPPAPSAERTQAELVSEAAVDSCIERFLAFGAAPSVDGYVAMFAPGGTLLDAGWDQPITGAAIHAAMAGTLALMADFHLRPARIVRQGPAVFVVADNAGTVSGTPLRWSAVYCFTVEPGGHISAGRRYYDQAGLQRALHPTLPHALADGATADGTAASRPDATPATTQAERAAAWNAGDVDALVAALPADVVLTAPDLDRPATGRDAARQHVAGLLALADDLTLAPGASATRGGATAFELRGTIGSGPDRRPFGLVEVVGPGPAWLLAHDTLTLLAPEARGAGLQAHLLGDHDPTGHGGAS